MRKILPFCCAILFSLLSASLLAANVNGYIEKVMLLPDHIAFDAKLDTGAATSSLNVKHIRIFKQNSKTQVAFDIYDKTTLLKHATYPLIKMISIKKRASEGKSPAADKRPLINMQFCLGGEINTIEVNLMDRQNFNYPFLLGREAMRKFNAVINPRKKYINPLKCQ